MIFGLTPCPDCHGTGGATAPCPICGGAKEVYAPGGSRTKCLYCFGAGTRKSCVTCHGAGHLPAELVGEIERRRRRGE
ncbi:MAG TPA: hypothetical protein VKT77_20515 [Chthonomonadaceae bacterium]|nr:hypothetical protein [Chthonomonadaceae bacterium]